MSTGTEPVIDSGAMRVDYLIEARAVGDMPRCGRGKMDVGYRRIHDWAAHNGELTPLNTVLRREEQDGSFHRRPSSSWMILVLFIISIIIFVIASWPK